MEASISLVGLNVHHLLIPTKSSNETRFNELEAIVGALKWSLYHCPCLDALSRFEKTLSALAVDLSPHM